MQGCLGQAMRRCVMGWPQTASVIAYKGSKFQQLARAPNPATQCYRVALGPNTLQLQRHTHTISLPLVDSKNDLDLEDHYSLWFCARSTCVRSVP